MDKRIHHLFTRYQEGKATEEEIRLVEAWYESHYGQQGRKLSRNEEISVFSDLDDRMQQFLDEQESPVIKRWNFRWLQVAALFFMVLASGLYFMIGRQDKIVPEETYTEIRSLNGAKKEVILKDGTSVWLNSGSSIYISSRYGEGKREVKLSGEAFFDVHHDRKRPFIIHSGKLQTTVLGTSFNIKAYPGEEKMKVTVSTGKVKVEAGESSGKAELVAKGLIHNQALVYNTLKDSHDISIVNADSVSSWRSNHLIFDNATYTEIAAGLERWYDLHITLDHITDQKKYTLSFYNERPDKVLNVLSSLTGTTYDMNGRNVTIRPKKP